MSNSDTAQSMLRACENADFTTLGAYLTDDFTFSGPVPVPLNKAQFIGLMQGVVAGIPNWHFNESAVDDQGDTVVVTVAITGDQTHTLANVIPGVPPVAPTGKHFQIPTEHLTVRFSGGNISAIEVDHVPGGGIPGMYAQIGHPLSM